MLAFSLGHNTVIPSLSCFSWAENWYFTVLNFLFSVYNLDSYEKLAYIPTHEGDVLCVDYSQNGDMLASASRDRCVHAFDSCYNPTHTVADHSAAVTAVKFAQNGNDVRKYESCNGIL